MDWKTKWVLPPNCVTLQHLKELRMKEKAALELKLREEAEAEYKSRLEEQERLKKLRQEEEEEEVKRRIDEEKKMKEEEEEEERLKREQIMKTRTVVCGEPSRRTRKKNFKKYQEADDQEEEVIVVSEAKKVENLEEGKKKKWGKRKKKKDYEKEEALELEAQRGVIETLKSETKSMEEEVIPDTKPKGFIQKGRRQRNFESKGIAVEKIVMNQKVEEIGKKIGDLNVNVNDDKKKKKIMESKAVKQFSQPQMSYIDTCPHSQIKDFGKHGKHIDSAMNPRNASRCSLVWAPKTDEKQN